jgi:hypothetical protein
VIWGRAFSEKQSSVIPSEIVDLYELVSCSCGESSRIFNGRRGLYFFNFSREHNFLPVNIKQQTSLWDKIYWDASISVSRFKLATDRDTVILLHFFFLSNFTLIQLKCCTIQQTRSPRLRDCSLISPNALLEGTLNLMRISVLPLGLSVISDAEVISMAAICCWECAQRGRGFLHLYQF